jgi:hypothetical protein
VSQCQFDKGGFWQKKRFPLFEKEGPGEILDKSGDIYFFSSTVIARDAECTGTVASRSE